MLGFKLCAVGHRISVLGYGFQVRGGDKSALGVRFQGLAFTLYGSAALDSASTASGSELALML